MGPAGCLTTPAPTQTLYNKTAEALDQMLQTLLTRDPTADELHLLLSVRAAGSAGRATQVGLGQRVDQGRGPRGARAGSGAGSGPGGLRADLSRAHSDLGHLGEEGRGPAGGHWMPHQRGDDGEETGCGQDPPFHPLHNSREAMSPTVGPGGPMSLPPPLFRLPSRGLALT